MLKKCLVCGVDFNVKGNERIKNAKFCSLKCYHKSGMKRGERKPELRVYCYNCGKRFLPNSNQRKVNKRFFCSEKCHIEAINSDTKYNCDHCGKEFIRKKYQFREGSEKFYCSTECRNKANRGENYNPNRIDYRDGVYKRLSKKLRECAKHCESCKKTFKKYEVHHIIPPWLFDSREEAHDEKNLIVLCKKCHRKRHAKMMKFFFDKFREFCKSNKDMRDDIIKNWNNTD